MCYKGFVNPARFLCAPPKCSAAPRFARWFCLPPAIDRLRAGRRTPLRLLRADGEEREALPSVPISGRSEPSAASTRQSLSSYPAGRQWLVCFRLARPVRRVGLALLP